VHHQESADLLHFATVSQSDLQGIIVGRAITAIREAIYHFHHFENSMSFHYLYTM
jgi:hypothetical protein